LTVQLPQDFVQNLAKVVRIQDPNAVPVLDHGLFGWNPHRRKDQYFLKSGNGDELTVEAFGDLHAIAIGLEKLDSFEMRVDQSCARQSDNAA
jgi:hypothetical protein